MGLLAESYGLRPSALLGLTTDEWAAYQFDFAALRWVEHVKSEVSGGKRLARVLEEDSRQKHAGMTKGQDFASWREAGAARRMKVPDSGVW